jgi:rod shape-determining protein MreC
MPKKRLLLFFFIIASLILMTYQSKSENILPFKFLNNIFNSIQGIKYSVQTSLTSPFKRMLLREEENKKLKAELSKLQREQQRYNEVFLENKRLRELLSLKEKTPRYITAAHIIAKNIDQWSNRAIIDKGSSDGVEKDMIAITQNGLVGKISGVYQSYSYLLLLTDINFSAAARLQNSRIEGIVSGTGFKKCKLNYIPYEEKVDIGEIVITSGLDLLFPPGIPIGYVSRVNAKGEGMFQDIEVTPFEDNARTEELLIIQRG